MAKIVIYYSTTDGHSTAICLRLKKVIEDKDHLVTILSANDDPCPDLSSFDKIVVGSSIRYGKHNKTIIEFIKTNWQMIDQKPNAFFSVNLVARKHNKNTPKTNPYVKKFLQKIPWKPQLTTVFAGKLQYEKYGFWDRTMIRLIMKITKGPTDLTTAIEFTDWNEVDRFGKFIRAM